MSFENRILIGDCRGQMQLMPPGIVQCAVTSPPYWGLRDYQVSGQIGNEKTPELYIATMVDVFREVRRVLRDDGVLFLNLGDSYTSGGRGSYGVSSLDSKQATNSAIKSAKRPPQPGNLKSGDLCNIPHRVAEAMQADGWFWRSTIIWAKKSPMPESIAGWRWVQCRVKIETAKFDASRNQPGRTGVNDGHRDCGSFNSTENATKWEPCPGCDKCLANGGLVLRRGKWRPTTSHEYIFLFSKSERYFADGDAVQEETTCRSPGNKRQKYADAYAAGDEGYRTKQNLGTLDARETRNPRSVLTLSSEGFKGKHFAVFPSRIPRLAIMAGTSSAGCCPQCRSCHAPIVESERVPTRPGRTNVIDETGMSNRDTKRHVAITRIIGYRATCDCNAGEPVPCLVLDPFLGSGTTGLAAKWLKRSYVGCELNTDYAAIAQKRIDGPPPKWAIPENVRRAKKPVPESPLQKMLILN